MDTALPPTSKHLPRRPETRRAYKKRLVPRCIFDDAVVEKLDEAKLTLDRNGRMFDVNTLTNDQTHGMCKPVGEGMAGVHIYVTKPSIPLSARYSYGSE